MYTVVNTLIWLLLVSLSYCGTVEYYVTPTQPPNPDCPQTKPCYTLDEYAMNYSQQLSNQKDVSLFFLNGVHTLSHNLSISNTVSLFLNEKFDNMSYSYMDTESDVVRASIHIHLGCHITFENINSLQIENIHLHETIYNRKYSNYLWHTDSESPTLVLNVSIVRFIQVSIESCKINTIATAIQVFYCQLTDTKITILYIPQDEIFSILETKILFFWSYLSGASQIIYINNIDMQNKETQHLTVNINNCNIINKRKLSLLDEILYLETIRFLVGFQTHVQIDITDTFFVSKISIRAEEHNNNIRLRIQNSEIIGSTEIIQSESKHTKTEIYFTDSVIKMSLIGNGLSIISNFANTIIISLTNTILTTNNMAMEILIRNDDFDMDFNFNESSKVTEPLSTENMAFQSVNSVLLQNVTVAGNFIASPDSANIRVLNVKMMINNCTFTNNQGSAIQAYFSTVTLSGDTVFANNSGVKGGALSLYQSRMILYEPFKIWFIGNHVETVGGAIYVKQVLSNDHSVDSCFYRIRSSNNKPTGYNLPGKLIFENNSARNGGNDVYGGFLHSTGCRRTRREQANNGTIFNSYNQSSWSSVSSDPTRVCLCDDKGIPQCAVLDYIYANLPSSYPGEHFTLPAIIVGYEFGTVPGIVYSYIVQDGSNASLGANQHIQEIRRHRICSLVNFTIETPTTNVTNATILLSAKQYRNDDLVNLLRLISRYAIKPLIGDVLYHPVLLTVPMENCPIGFNLSPTPPHVCKCHNILEHNGVNRCIIKNHTGLVYRSGTVWVSASFNDNESNSFLIHQYCPYRYCKPQNISVDLRFPDVQCELNHSGVLCGRCHDNFSLALGSSKCLPCNNTYTSLLIVFALAGLILVLFVKIIDLTVAKGTINGLIFYANILWANYSIFIPNAETAHPALKFLHIFIAWLNLDLGIETCFISGLDAYWKTWLQYVFPIYIWSIVGAMIISAHYSTRASRILGNNSVPVLATLILLSYAKLLRCIITSLGFSLLNYSHGTRVVWSYDGNVSYFGAAHSILFLVALAALLFLWLPYTLVLLTLQWLRRKAYMKPLRWINRWKPFFDAYLGQLKPTHHYWFGLLLLVRVVLLVLFAITSSILPRLNILAIAITGVGLILLIVITGLFYKSLYLSLFEISFIVNLTLLGIANLYMQDANSTLAYVSISIVLIKFLCIVVYHTWARIHTTYTIYKRRHTNTDQLDNIPERELEEVANVPARHMLYREPLLDST